eukprot:5369384-Pyramimonas_sp.AAC.1
MRRRIAARRPGSSSLQERKSEKPNWWAAYPWEIGPAPSAAAPSLSRANWSLRGREPAHEAVELETDEAGADTDAEMAGLAAHGASSA